VFVLSFLECNGFQTLHELNSLVQSSQGCDLPNFPSQSYLGEGIIALKPNVGVTIGNRGEHTLLAKKAQGDTRCEIALFQVFVLNRLD